MSTPTCEKCVAREYLKRPISTSELFIWTFVSIMFIGVGLTPIVVGEPTARVIFGLVISFIFLVRYLSTIGVSWFRRNLIGEYLYLFRDEEKNMHCHRELPSIWDLARKIEASCSSFGPIIRVRNGGYFRQSHILRMDKNSRVCIYADLWRIRSWDAINDLCLDDCVGGIIPIAKENKRQCHTLLGQQIFDYLDEVPCTVVGLLRELLQAKKRKEKLESELIDIKDERNNALEKAERMERSLLSFVQLTNGILDDIHCSRKNIGKSKHAQKIRERIENFLVTIPIKYLEGFESLIEYRQHILAERNRKDIHAAIFNS